MKFKEVIDSFQSGKAASAGNYSTNGTYLFLFGNTIACRKNDGTIEITTAGWWTPTTVKALNCIKGVRVTRKQGQIFLNGKTWNGKWAIPQKDGFIQN